MYINIERTAWEIPAFAHSSYLHSWNSLVSILSFSTTAILHKTTRELCSFNMWPILDLFMSNNITHNILQMVVLLWLPIDFRQPVKARGISQSLEIFFYVTCIKLNIPQLQMENSLVNNDSSLPYSQTLWCCTGGRVYLWVPLCSA